MPFSEQVQGQRQISEVFPVLPLDLSKEETISEWAKALHGLTNELAGRGGVKQDIFSRVHEGIGTWVVHQDHGAEHSYFTYQVVRELAQRGGEQIGNSRLQAMAVFHDLMQIIPLVDPDTGRELNREQRKYHPMAMAMGLRHFGRKLGFSSEEIRNLWIPIKYHDAVYEGRADLVEKITTEHPEIGLFSDGDKFGTADTLNPKEIAAEAMKRNRKGAEKPGGWYLFRDDLSSEDRQEWKYGDRWLSDRLAALLAMLKISCFSETGKKMAGLVIKELKEQAPTIYAEEYDDTVGKIRKWKEAKREEVEVVLVGKDQEPELVKDWSDMTGVINDALTKRLDLHSRYLREDFEPRGWKVKVLINKEEFVIDPSIAHFAFDSQGKFNPEIGRADFIQALEAVLANN